MHNDDRAPSDSNGHEQNGDEASAIHLHSTGQSLLEFIQRCTRWEGDDLEQCLADLKATRGGFWFDEDGYLVPSPQRVLHLETDAGESIDLDVTDIQDIESFGKPWYGPDSTGQSLLELVQGLPDWAGDDFDESLEEVIRSRTQARF